MLSKKDFTTVQQAPLIFGISQTPFKIQVLKDTQHAREALKEVANA